MVISQAQFCVNLLTEYFNPGGPINTKSQLSDDPKRPLVSARITEGFTNNVASNVEVELYGILDEKGDNLFSAECFSFNCFKESGIDSFVPDISDVCIVNTGTETKYMDNKTRTKEGLSCFINNFGKKQYFVRGTKNTKGSIYVADFGIVNPIFGNEIIIERNVPFFFKKKVGSLYARTSTSLPIGIRFITIKEITKFNTSILGSIYGQLQEQFYFPHNILKPARSFTAEDQEIDIENLAINLLLFTNFKRFQAKPNQYIYRNINYSSPEIEAIINNSATTLINLINKDINVQQLGTIPKTITSYIKNQNQYNSSADIFYLEETLNCFDSSCFDPTCFQSIINKSLIKRDISNRSLAWVVLFLISYSINYNIDIEDSIVSIIEYLITQKDYNTNLFYKGWNQITNSSNEIENTYSSALTQDTNIHTSTNIAILISLLKGFELTQNFRYLSIACNLYNSIEKYLVSENGLYNHSLNLKNPSLESITYQLQIIDILQDFKNINEVIDFFKFRLIAPPLPELEPVLLNIDNVLVGTDLTYITSTSINTNSDSDNLLFTPTTYDSNLSLDDIYKYNYLIYSNLKKINGTFSINFIDVIDTKYSLIENRVVEDRVNNALIFAIGCIIENQSYLSFDNSKFNTLIDFYNLRFQKEAIFNNMLNTLPLNFGWFNENVLNKNSNVGSLLYSQACELAIINTRYEYLNRIVSLENLYGVILNRKAEDFGLTRLIKETDSSLKNRILLEIYKRASTIRAFTDKLSELNSDALINDNYKAALATEDFDEDLFVNKWGEGYLSGPNLISTNISTIHLAQPLEKDVKEEIERIKPAGIKLQIIETFSFSIQTNNTLINITDSSGSCDNYDTESNVNIITENNSSLCIESASNIAERSFIEASIYDFPNIISVATAPNFETLLRVDKIISDSNNNNTFTFTYKTNTLGQTLWLYKEEYNTLNITSISLPSNLNNNYYQVFQTDNFLLIVYNTTLITINKDTLTLTTLITSLPSEIEILKGINKDNNSIYIYSNKTTDTSIYHYEWNESAPNNLDIINILSKSSSNIVSTYYYTNNNIKRLDQGSTINIYSTTNFGVNEILENNITPNINVIRDVIELDNTTYFVNIVEQSPFNIVNVYTQNNNNLILLFTDNTIGELNHLTQTTTNNKLTGELLKLDNYLLLSGSNKAYNLSSNNIASINSFICSTDINNIDNLYSIQGINIDNTNTAIVAAVNLLDSRWKRYKLNKVLKTC